MAAANPKAQRMNLRISEAEKSAITRAAEVSKQRLSEFVIDAAVDRAESILADRTRFSLDADSWDAFQEALDRPAQVRPELVDLFSKPSVLERS